MFSLIQIHLHVQLARSSFVDAIEQGLGVTFGETDLVVKYRRSTGEIKVGDWFCGPQADIGEDGCEADLVDGAGLLVELWEVVSGKEGGTWSTHEVCFRPDLFHARGGCGGLKLFIAFPDVFRVPACVPYPLLLRHQGVRGRRARALFPITAQGEL